MKEGGFQEAVFEGALLLQKLHVLEMKNALLIDVVSISIESTVFSRAQVGRFFRILPMLTGDYPQLKRTKAVNNNKTNFDIGRL